MLKSYVLRIKKMFKDVRAATEEEDTTPYMIFVWLLFTLLTLVFLAVGSRIILGESLNFFIGAIMSFFLVPYTYLTISRSIDYLMNLYADVLKKLTAWVVGIDDHDDSPEKELGLFRTSLAWVLGLFNNLQDTYDVKLFLAFALIVPASLNTLVHWVFGFNWFLTYPTTLYLAPIWMYAFLSENGDVAYRYIGDAIRNFAKLNNENKLTEKENGRDDSTN